MARRPLWALLSYSTGLDRTTARDRHSRSVGRLGYRSSDMPGQLRCRRGDRRRNHGSFHTVSSHVRHCSGSLDARSGQPGRLRSFGHAATLISATPGAETMLHHRGGRQARRRRTLGLAQPRQGTSRHPGRQHPALPAQRGRPLAQRPHRPGALTHARPPLPIGTWGTIRTENSDPTGTAPEPDSANTTAKPATSKPPAPPAPPPFAR